MLQNFFVFEGGEGSGKSSISKWVVEQLKERGHNALWTREPGGSPYAEKIRELIIGDDAKDKDAETMLALFWAARRDHLLQTIIPEAKKGTVVICDRFDASTYAYQICGQERPQLSDLFWDMRAHYLGCSTPRSYLIFDVDPLIGLERVKRRPGPSTHFDDRNLEFHQRVRAGFFEFASSSALIPNNVIDASLLEEKVKNTVIDLVKRLLNDASAV